MRTTQNIRSPRGPIVTAMLKGPSGNHFALKAGDAQSGQPQHHVGRNSSGRLQSQKKQGAIILGTGGDGSTVARATSSKEP